MVLVLGYTYEISQTVCIAYGGAPLQFAKT